MSDKQTDRKTPAMAKKTGRIKFNMSKDQRKKKKKKLKKKKHTKLKWQDDEAEVRGENCAGKSTYTE